MLKRKKIGVRLAEAQKEADGGKREKRRRAEGGVAGEGGEERNSTKGSRTRRDMDCRGQREKEN